MGGRDVMRAGTAGTLLLLATLVHHVGSESVWCYECGTGVAGKPDCQDFARASSWTQFWRECPPQSVCVKTKPAWDDDKLERNTVRGCSPLTSLQGTVHREGCWTHPSVSSALTCYCHAALCNAAPAQPQTQASAAALVLTLVVAMAAWKVGFL